ncbi:hypothetical protein NX059_003716 [Plenodomus lindquistii]|nr:hypothetical protein NX059_003716 [Plenodomus lindquistii]
MVERYTTVALPMESYMPVARNEFANSLEDIDSDSDCEQYKTGSSTSHYMVRAKEKTPPSYSLAIQASEERRLEPSQHNHVNNVRPLLISSTKEVESETPTKGKAQKGKNKDQSKGRKANLVGEREVLLSRADGRHQAIPIKSGDTFASLRRKCLVNDDSINLWHNDTILGDHTMAKFVDTLWASKDAVHLTMQAFEHDPEDDPVIFYYTGKMNGTTDKEENGTGSQEDDTELSEPDSDVVSGLGTDHLNKTGTRRSTRGKG